MVRGATLRQFARREGGSFAVVTAGSAAVLLLAVAGAININDRVRVTAELQTAADAAVLHAARVQGEWQNRPSGDIRRKWETIWMLRQNLGQNIGGEKWRVGRKSHLHWDDENSEVTLTITYDYKPVLPVFMFSKSQKVEVRASANYAQSGVQDTSIIFVLDVSSSMSKDGGGSQARIDAVKDGVEGMFNSLQASVTDPNRARNAIRTAMVAYDKAIEDSSHFTHGWASTKNAILDLETDKGTNSSVGLAWADDALKTELKFRAPKKDGDDYELRQIVILMTDGNNNESAFDVASKATCDAMKARGAIIYSIGFQAPSDGVAMLQNCATKSSTDPSLTLEEQTEGYMFEASSSSEFIDIFKELGTTLLDEPPRLTR